ncbi:hypothetical protein LPJ66_004308, partial [Kickxella alabastrina]
WVNPTGEWRLGAKQLRDICPGAVWSRAQREREEVFQKKVQALADATSVQQHQQHQQNQQQKKKNNKADEQRAEIDAQADVLSTLGAAYSDSGPLLDCVVFHDGEQWRAAIDTDETGDLSAANALGAYKLTGDIAALSKRHLFYYTLNFYTDVLSIVTACGSHATHVAGIVAAHHPEDPQNNGVAPGAQLISLMIGDHRVDSLETGVGLTRAAIAIIEANADVANMSFGEPTATPNAGQWVKLVREEVIRRSHCVFVASAGNEGPALSSVGAPGGTSDSIIGVGAFVGYEQMRADHALADPVSDTVFTWSSRGPAANGLRGVDVYAPGSAISSYPAYTQSRLQLANGTSMSAPNLSGCLALLLSAWKQEHPGAARISPFRVKHAMAASAKPIGDELGAGLVQVDAAWQFLRKHEARPHEDVEYTVDVQDSDDMQGIYLRSPEDSAVARHLQVRVQPVFPTDRAVRLENDSDGRSGEAQSQRMYDFEQRLVLTATAAWVRVPEFIYLNSSGSTIAVGVDATALAAGQLHVAAVHGYDSANVGRGPVFTIPITVTKPLHVEPSACVRFDRLRMQPTEIVRRFIAVPEGATRATIHLRSRNDSPQTAPPSTFYLHCLQLSPQRRFTAYELKKSVQIGHKNYVAGGGSAEQQARFSMNVLGGVTLEVCIAKFWDCQGTHDIDARVEFTGIAPASSVLVLNGNTGIARADFAALVCPEYDLRPTATLHTLRTALRPVESSVAPLFSDRDAHPESGLPIYRLALDYKLSTKADSSSVHLRIPAFDSMIYESWADDFALAIFDANKRRVRSLIGYTKPVTLAKKGDYLVRVQVRHRSPKLLEPLRNTALVVDTRLSAPASLQIRRTHSAQFVTTSYAPVQKPTMARGTRFPLFIKTELSSVPTDASPGDVLLGSLVLNTSSAPVDIEYVVPAKIVSKPDSPKLTPAKVAEEVVPAAEKERKEMEEALRKVRIDWVKKTTDDAARESLVLDLIKASATDADRASVLSTHLESIDALGKTTLPWSDKAFTLEKAKRAIKVADELYALTYGLALTAKLYESQKPTSVEEKEAKEAAGKARDQLVSALTTKSRALAFLHFKQQANTDASATTDASPSAAAAAAASETSDFVDVSAEDATDSIDALEEYTKAVAQLKQWVDGSQADGVPHLLASLPLLVAKRQFARALQPVLKWLSKSPLLSSNADERKCMRELRDCLLEKLQWNLWVEHFRAVELTDYPTVYEAL